MQHKITMSLVIISIPLLMVLNLAVGSVSIPIPAIWDILTHATENLTDRSNPDSSFFILHSSFYDVWQNIIIGTRLPQTFTAMACGAGLSVAGLLMQTVFHNPLASPSVLGISTAASLGVAFLVLVSGGLLGEAITHFGIIGNAALTIAAIVGALLALLLIVELSHHVHNNVTLLIAGVMIGYIASAITGVMKYFSTEEDVHTFVVWGLGSFARVTGGQVWVFTLLIAVVLPFSMLLVKPLNLLLLGDEYAGALGLNTNRSRTQIITLAGILTAITTAYCGPIMFLGLAVPHIARGLFHTENHRVLLPATLFAGMSLALICNIIARLPGMEGALPVNSVTSLTGAPVALWVLLRKGRKL